MGYISRKKHKDMVGGENKHPYLKGFIFWRNNMFWENRVDMTEKSKEYFRDSLNRMAKVYQLPTVDESLN